MEKKIEYLYQQFGGKKNTYSDILIFEHLNDEYIAGAEVEFEGSPDVEYIELNQIEESDIIDENLVKLKKINDADVIKLLSQNIDYEELEEDFEKHIVAVGREWIETGYIKQKESGNSKCLYCMQDTSGLKIIKQYEEYLNSKKNAVEKLINMQIENIKELKADFIENIKKIKKELPTIKKKVELLEVKSDGLKITESIDFYEELEFLLIKKMQRVDLSVGKDDSEIMDIVYAYNYKIDEINVEIDKVMTLIKNINSKINGINRLKSLKRKPIAYKTIVDVYASEEVSRYRDSLRKINIKQGELDKLILSMPTKDKKIMISRTVNEIMSKIGLNKYFINDEYELVLHVNDDEFDISDDTVRVSDGERSVIAFSYFLASVIQELEKTTDIKNYILYIDDPISSVSYDYMHGITAVLKGLNRIYKEQLGLSNIEGPQLIVATHNLQFYNRLIQSVFRDKVKRLMIEIDRSPSGKVSLRKIKDDKKISMYITALKRLKKYVDGDDVGNVGVDIRLILETICNFYMMKLCVDSIKEIFKDCGSCCEDFVLAVGQDFCHSSAEDFLDWLPADAILKPASEKLIEMLNNKYPKQLDYINNN